MEEGQPSFTAIGSAMMRAAHLLLDSTPKILQDELALGFSGFENEAALSTALEARRQDTQQRSTPEFAQFLLRSLRSIMTVRNRYAEDELNNALQRGVTQYVLLGAGLDSFAYRRRDLSGVLRVFEVDYPSTQQWKRARLREKLRSLITSLSCPSILSNRPFGKHWTQGGIESKNQLSSLGSALPNISPKTQPWDPSRNCFVGPGERDCL